MVDTVDVAIIGAGPYGLSLAAHLRAAGVEFRLFGHPMRLWREAMPAGMFLKSQPFASNLSAPSDGATLKAYCQATGQRYVPYGEPVPLERFTGYGEWFCRTQAPDLERCLVTSVRPVAPAHAAGVSELAGAGFELILDTGERLRARRVVVAAGVEHFAYVPAPLKALPARLCGHTSAYSDLAGLAGRDVTVIGAGQSALETAALAHERGATVRVLARAPELAWNGVPLPDQRQLASKLREPEAALGSGWSTWFYSNQPALFRRLPARRRAEIARTALGPAGAHWLRARVMGRVSVLTGCQVIGAAPGDGETQLTVRRDGNESVIATEHVIAGTGYRADPARLRFLDASLVDRLHTLGGGPAVDGAFQSTAPGLYFTGPAVASTFGPVMRFVHGCDFAARRLGHRLAAAVPRRPARAVTRVRS